MSSALVGMFFTNSITWEALTIENNYVRLGGLSRVMWYVELHPCTCFHLPSQSMSLVGAFNPFTFKVIIDMHDPITMFFVVLGLFCVDLFLLLCFLPREVPLVL